MTEKTQFRLIIGFLTVLEFALAVILHGRFFPLLCLTGAFSGVAVLGLTVISGDKKYRG